MYSGRLLLKYEYIKSGEWLMVSVLVSGLSSLGESPD